MGFHLKQAIKLNGGLGLSGLYLGCLLFMSVSPLHGAKQTFTPEGDGSVSTEESSKPSKRGGASASRKGAEVESSTEEGTASAKKKKKSGVDGESAEGEGAPEAKAAPVGIPLEKVVEMNQKKAERVTAELAKAKAEATVDSVRNAFDAIADNETAISETLKSLASAPKKNQAMAFALFENLDTKRGLLLNLLHLTQAVERQRNGNEVQKGMAMQELQIIKSIKVVLGDLDKLNGIQRKAAGLP